MKARRISTCPQCRGAIKPGDVIGMPEVKNRAGGNRFRGCWYCEPCATDTEELGPSVPCISVAALEAEQARRAPIAERLRQRREKNEAAS